MLSIQEMKDKDFEKAIFGGYDVKAVDEFREEVIIEFTKMQKEKMALQQKLKDLTTKNEEYAAVENSMRKALMSAQEIASDIVKKAEIERDKILTDVRESAQEQINTYRSQIADEKQKLQSAQESTAVFVSKMTAYYENELKALVGASKNLPKKIEKAPKVDNKQEFTLNLSKENEAEFKAIHDAEQKESVTQNILEKIKKETINPEVLSPVVEKEEVSSSKNRQNSSKFEFSELKFGKNYSE